MSCIHGYWAGTEEYRGASRGRSLEGELKPGRCGVVWGPPVRVWLLQYTSLECGVAMATCSGLHTKYKPLLQKDKMFLRMLGSYKVCVCVCICVCLCVVMCE